MVPEGLHDRPLEKFGDEVLAEDAHGAPVHGLGREGMSVSELAGHAAEEITRDHAAAVMGDASHVDRCRVPRCLNDFDVVEEKVHLHSSHGRPHSRVGAGAPHAPPAARRWYRVT